MGPDTSGYNVTPTVSVPVQTSIGAFDTVNLFFRYDVAGDSIWTRDLSFKLYLDNVLDQAPPIYRVSNSANPYGYGNGFTLGRMVTLGVSKKF